MLKRIFALLLTVAFVAVSFGCTYNYSSVRPTSTLRRLAISGENLRMAQKDLDRFLGLKDYPSETKWAH